MKRLTTLSHSLFCIAVAACGLTPMKTVQAKESHVHGHGKLLIAQEGQQWHLAFELPAANLLGFEHKPETAAQRVLVQEWQAKLQDPTKILGMMGHCELTQATVSLPGVEGSGHDEHHERENDSDHDDEHHEEHHHEDVDANYEFTCDSEVKGIDVVLFKQAPSLQEIEVQWIADNGQGMRELTPASPSLRW